VDKNEASSPEKLMSLEAESFLCNLAFVATLGKFAEGMLDNVGVLLYSFLLCAEGKVDTPSSLLEFHRSLLSWIKKNKKRAITGGG
jgi:hypothetical protein